MVYSDSARRFRFELAPVHNINHYAFSLKDNIGLKTVAEFNISSMYPKLISLAYCFSGCTYLETVNLSNLRPPKCDNITYMFKCCENLAEVDFSNCGFNGHTATEGLFQGVGSLQRVCLSNCDEDFINSVITELYAAGYDESLIEY